MEDVKKRKIEHLGNNQRLSNLNDTAASAEELRALLDPLSKPQLVDLLARAGARYSSIAEEIKSVASADPALRKLFVRGLAWNTTSDTLYAAFQEHGEIEEGAVIYDKATGKSRGYGFITYKDIESAQLALRAPSKMIDGRMAVCNLASEGLSNASSTPDQASRKLYIGGLSPEITSKMLLTYFGRHGDIEEGSVAYDKDSNRSRGFGFVTYRTVEAAKNAIDDPHKMLGGRHITVKLADNNKPRVGQPQLAGHMLQVPPHMSGGYQQPGVGYNYPWLMSTYPGSYTSPSTAANLYSGLPQYPYPQYGGAKKDTPSPEAALSGYPYYLQKQ